MAKRKNKLEIGKFYMAYGGNQHPAQIYEKTDYGTYLSIKTGTTDGKDMILIQPAQEGLGESFIHNRPFEGTRRDYGDRELLGISFNPVDNDIIEEVKTHRPVLSKRAKERYK